MKLLWQYCTVATAQGKPGIWMFIFSDRENGGNLPILYKIPMLCWNISMDSLFVVKFELVNWEKE